MAEKIKLRSGDKVTVIAGKDKGKSGKILAVNPSKKKVVVEGVNIVSKHKKARSAQDKGGIIKREEKIDLSNVQIICPECKKATRISYGEEKGKKYRKCKKCGASLDKDREIKKAVKATAKAEKAKEVKPVATKIEKAKVSDAPKKLVKNTTKKASTVRTKSAAVRHTADKG